MAGEKELKDVINRVTADVLREMKGYEAGTFKVSDLRAQLEDLAEVGGNQAWKITYDTSGERIVDLGGRLGEIGGSAWKITYDTSGERIVPAKGK